MGESPGLLYVEEVDAVISGNYDGVAGISVLGGTGYVRQAVPVYGGGPMPPDEDNFVPAISIRTQSSSGDWGSPILVETAPNGVSYTSFGNYGTLSDGNVTPQGAFVSLG